MRRSLAVLFLLIACVVARGDAVQVPAAAFYRYDSALALDVEEKKLSENESGATYHLIYTSAHEQRVTAILMIPKGTGPFPAVIAQHGYQGNKQVDYVAAVCDFLVKQGYAVMAIDAQYHGERAKAGRDIFMYATAPHTARDAFAQTVIDLRRAVDVLQARPEIDAKRMGYWGASMGAMLGAVFCGLDQRIRAACLVVGGGGIANTLSKRFGLAPSGDTKDALTVIEPVNYVGMISPRPLLMLNGKQDKTIPVEAAQALFDAAGEPKRIVWYDAGHTDLPPGEVMGETLRFFSQNLSGGTQQTAPGSMGAASPEAAGSAASLLKAGAARVDITPDLNKFKKLSLGGYGDRFGKYAEGVHDPIFARALVIQRGDAKVAIVALDAIGVPGELKDAAMKQIADLGFAPEAVVIGASHSHCAPECLNPQGDLIPRALGYFHKDFFDWMAERIATAIRQANANLQDCALSVGSAQLEGLNTNRRDGETTVDREMTVLKVQGKAGTIAALVNWTAHATIMGPETLLVSGEWPGEMARTVEKALPGAVAVYLNGAEGDQTTAGGLGQGFERVNRYGQRMAQEALTLLKSARPMDDPVLAVSGDLVKLPPYKVSPAFEETTGKEYHLDAKTVESFAALLLPSKAPVAAVRIGDLVLLTVPGEMTSQIGMPLKERVRTMGAKHPIIAGLANAGIFYIVSAAQYRAGGYETATSFYGENIGPFISDAIAQHAQVVLQK
jgi:dienelactone hydrolase